MPTEKMLLKEHVRTHFTARIRTRDEMNKLDLKPRPTAPNTINIFTDGSRYKELK